MVGPHHVPTLVHSHSHDPITLPLHNRQNIDYTRRTILGLENVIMWFGNKYTWGAHRGMCCTQINSPLLYSFAQRNLNRIESSAVAWSKVMIRAPVI